MCRESHVWNAMCGTPGTFVLFRIGLMLNVFDSCKLDGNVRGSVLRVV